MWAFCAGCGGCLLCLNEILTSSYSKCDKIKTIFFLNFFWPLFFNFSISIWGDPKKSKFKCASLKISYKISHIQLHFHTFSSTFLFVHPYDDANILRLCYLIESWKLQEFTLLLISKFFHSLYYYLFIVLRYTLCILNSRAAVVCKQNKNL